MVGAFRRCQNKIDFTNLRMEGFYIKIKNVLTPRFAFTKVGIVSINGRLPAINRRHNLRASLTRAIAAAPCATKQVRVLIRGLPLLNLESFILLLYSNWER